MITLYRAAYQLEPRAPELFGLSTDEKPMTLANGDPMYNGAYFHEVDTGALYSFDQENNSWIAQP